MQIEPQHTFVLLLHGLAGNRLDMWRLSRHLRRSGFRTDTYRYRSLRARINQHIDPLADRIAEIDGNPDIRSFFIVGHSMGGIIARAALQETNQRFEKLTGLVMLAPPNRGSHVARKLAPILGWAYPTLHQLSDDPSSFVNQLPDTMDRFVNQIGIISASKDRVIRQECVPLPSQDDFAVIEGHHGVLPWYPATLRMVENFIRVGEFQGGVQGHSELKPATVNLE